MNILFFNDIPFNPSSGGIERITDTLTKEFLKLGYGMFYLTLKDEGDDIHYDFPVKTNNIPSNSLNITDEDIEFYYRFLRDNKIDIVINQRGLMGKLSNFTLTTPSDLNIKKITVFHSSPLGKPKPLSDILQFDSARSSAMAALKISVHPFVISHLKLRQLKIKRQHTFVFNNSDKVCLLSDRFISELPIAYSRSIDKVVSIPNMNSYEEQNIDYSKKKRQILYVGRLRHSDKRVDRLIKIWGQIYKKNPYWELVIVGGGLAERSLKEYVTKHNIERVKFEGTQPDPKKYFEDASILCLTSSFEGFPLVLGEGMVHGCIPFCFNSFKAVYDIIDNNVNGMIVSAFNLSKYAKQLNKVMNDDELRLKMGRAAQEKAKLFSKENVINLWVDLFASLSK